MKYSEWNSVAEYLVSNLETLILTEGYKSGDRFLSEGEICSRFNVSRSSVREALRVMSATGIIELRRGCGAFVARTGEQKYSKVSQWYSKHQVELQDLIEVRLFIEPPAIEKAAGIITDKELENICKINCDLQKAVQNRRVSNVVALDEALHIAIVDGARNNFLSEINKSVQREVSNYRGKTYSLTNYFPLAQNGHDKIVMHLQNRDSEAARAEMTRHIWEVNEYFKEIEQNKER